MWLNVEAKEPETKHPTSLTRCQVWFRKWTAGSFVDLSILTTTSFIYYTFLQFFVYSIFKVYDNDKVRHCDVR